MKSIRRTAAFLFLGALLFLPTSLFAATLYVGAGGGGIFSMNPITGDVIERVADAAADHTFGNGTLFTADGFGVYSVDPITKVRTTLSSLSSTTIDYANGLLYVGAGGGGIFSMNPITGDVIERVADAAADHIFGNGTLFTADGFGVYSVDPITKVRTTLSSLSSTTIDYVSYVPLPPTAFLFASALGVVGYLRNRKLNS